MRLLVLGFLFLSLLSSNAKAELASLFGIGPKSQAMGGVALMGEQYSPFQVYTAPAALGFVHRVEIAASAQYMQPNLRSFGTLVLNSNGTKGDFPDAGVLPGGGNLLAFAIPLGRVHPVTLGGSIYMPFSTMIRVSGTPVDYPFYPLYTDLSRNFFFVLGAGYEFAEGWAFGINFRSTTKSTVSYVLRADGSVNYSASATEARSQSRLSYSVVYDHSHRHPESHWSAGLMYRGYAGMETKISADVTAFVPVQGELTSMPSYTPAEWVAMGSGKLFPWLTASADISRVIWSKYVSPYGSGNINSYVIGNRASQANFRDVTVLRFGFEETMNLGGKTVRQLAIRQGYQRHPSPVPDQSEDSNFVDSDRDLFSAGLGFGLANPWKDEDMIDFDLFAQYNLLKNRQISKRSSTNVGAPGYLAGGNIFLFGGGFSLRF